MNPAPDFTKICYRCEQPVRMSLAEYRADEANAHTCCAVCRAKLDIEAGFVGTPLSQSEASTSTSPAAPANPTP